MSWLCADETQTPGGCWLTAFLQLVAGPVWKGDLAGVSSYVPNPPCGEILPAIGENKASILTKTRAEGWKKKPKNRLESIDPIATEVSTLTFFVT